MDFAQALDIASTLAVFAGLVFTGWQLRLLQQQNAREATLQLLESFRSPEFVEGIWLMDNLPDGLSKAEIEARLGDRVGRLWLVMLSLENVGLLVSRRELSLEFVQEFFTGPIIVGWAKLGGYVRDLRQELNIDTPLEYFQWVAEQLAKRRTASPLPPAHIRLRDWQPD